MQKVVLAGNNVMLDEKRNIRDGTMIKMEGEQRSVYNGHVDLSR